MGTQKEISGRSILYWIDNEAAHIVALKAKRPSITMETLSRLAIWNCRDWRFGNAVAGDGMVSKSLVFLEPSGFDISSSRRKGSGKIWDGGQLAASHDLSLTWGPNHINILLQKLGTTSEHLSMICHPKSSMEGIVISGDLHVCKEALNIWFLPGLNQKNNKKERLNFQHVHIVTCCLYAIPQFFSWYEDCSAYLPASVCVCPL